MDFLEAIAHLVRLYYEEKDVRTGTVWKYVECENCHREYVYQLRRSAGAKGFPSRQELPRLASLALERRLERDCDLVPCPVCGWYQQAMIRKARRKARRDMPVLAMVVTLASLPLAFVAGFCANNPHAEPWRDLALPAGIAAGMCPVFGLGLAIVRFVRASLLDLNAADPEDRIRIGQSAARLVVRRREPMQPTFSVVVNRTDERRVARPEDIDRLCAHLAGLPVFTADVIGERGYEGPTLHLTVASARQPSFSWTWTGASNSFPGTRPARSAAPCVSGMTRTRNWNSIRPRYTFET
jgi:hypothetical protein